MNDCNCQKELNAASDTEEHVPDFTATGFTNEESFAFPPISDEILALSLSGCVKASYNASTNKICVNIPVIGKHCITSPVHIPINAELKACFKLCTKFGVPTGAKITIYLNGVAIKTFKVGSC